MATPGGGFRWHDEPDSRSDGRLNRIRGGFTLRADGDPGSRAMAIRPAIRWRSGTLARAGDHPPGVRTDARRCEPLSFDARKTGG